MSAVLLAVLLRGNLALAAAILLILALRRPVRRRFGASAAYASWLIAPVCLAAALLPATAPSGGFAPAVFLTVTRRATIDVHTFAGVAEVIIGIWAAGALTTAAIFAVRQVRFTRSLGRLTPSASAPDILLGEHAGAGPLVLGALRPRIVVPADFETRFRGEARALVLAHERVHLARGDAAINGLAALLQCLAWFNPLVHLAVRRLRIDQEIACDAVVLARRPSASRLYAETLIGALLAPVSAPFGCHWPAAGVHPLKERLMMLSTVSVSRRRGAFGLALVAVVGLAGAGAVWAANPAPAEVIDQPNWISKPTGDDLARFYPAEAAKARTGGDTLIECGVGGDGRLNACKVLRETPAEAGFGEAALKLSQAFQMTAVSGDGKQTGGAMVRIPIRFRVAAQPKP